MAVTYWVFVVFSRVNDNNASNTRVVKVTRKPHQLSNGCNVQLQLQLGADWRRVVTSQRVVAEA